MDTIDRNELVGKIRPLVFVAITLVIFAIAFCSASCIVSDPEWVFMSHRVAFAPESVDPYTIAIASIGATNDSIQIDVRGNYRPSLTDSSTITCRIACLISLTRPTKTSLPCTVDLRAVHVVVSGQTALYDPHSKSVVKLRKWQDLAYASYEVTFSRRTFQDSTNDSMALRVAIDLNGAIQFAGRTIPTPLIEGTLVRDRGLKLE